MTAKPLLFSGAEIAVILRKAALLEALPPARVLEDLRVTSGEVQRAEQTLVERGLLLPAPNRYRAETFLESELYELLQTLTQPLVVARAQIRRAQISAQPAPTFPPALLTFSWTPDLMLCNWVDGQGEHTFLPLATLDEAVAFILQHCGVDATRLIAPSVIVDPEALVNAADPRVLMSIVANVQSQPQPVAISWGVSHGVLWKLAAANNQAGYALVASTVDELHQQLVTLLQNAIQLSV